MIRSTGDRPHGDWWRTAVIYEIYIRSFADADGDGVGDIAGIRSRLPYLAELGVDAIWITPWYCSPMADRMDSRSTPSSLTSASTSGARTPQQMKQSAVR